MVGDHRRAAPMAGIGPVSVMKMGTSSANATFTLLLVYVPFLSLSARNNKRQVFPIDHVDGNLKNEYM